MILRHYIIFKRVLLYYMSMDALPLCMSIHHICAWYLRRAEEGTDPLK